jgi:hypothetical protein
MMPLSTREQGTMTKRGGEHYLHTLELAIQGVVPMEITFMDNGGKYNLYYVNS